MVPTVPRGKEGDGQMLTVTELSSFLAVSDQTLRTWCAKRTIPHGRFGRDIRFDRDQIQDWLAERWVVPQPGDDTVIPGQNTGDHARNQDTRSQDTRS